MKLLKNWYTDGAGYERERDCVGTLQGWYDKGNIIVDHGYGKTVEDIFGLPYTSTSEFAAIWNTNASAHYKGSPNLHFDGVAITETGYVVAVFTVYDTEGNETGIAYIDMQ